MNCSGCVRFCVFSIFVLTAIGLLISYRFDMNVNVVANFVQQYSMPKRAQATAQTSAPDEKVISQTKNIIPVLKNFSSLVSLKNMASGNLSDEILNIFNPQNITDAKLLNATLNSSKNSNSTAIKISIAKNQPTTLIPLAKNKTAETVCKFPQLLVDDPLIRPYLKTYGPLQCNKEKNWVYTDNGKFYIDSDSVNKHGEINCKYWRYDRTSENYFDEVDLGVYVNETLLSGDAFYAQCKAKDKTQYDNVHAAVPLPRGELASRLEKAKNESMTNKTTGLNMNVFIYLMDSVSRINFIRKLPKFYQLLTETMNASIMEGFNIVGDGTPWAVIPMLTGHFQTELPEARKRFDNASFIDQWPFIFKNFTSRGYVTSYAEEQPWYSAFTYKLKGFDKQPVDHYLRTFLTAVERYKDNHKPYCLGDTPRSLIWLQFWRQLQHVYRPLGGKQFSMMFSSETSHDDYNYVQTLDEHWTREFDQLYKQNYLNDTILIIMGDHGRRFGAVRQTQTGKLEEKLPFLATVVPPWFREKYPLSDANIKTNRGRLVTVFDLFETYMHVLDFKEDGGEGDRSKRGISLFKEIPAERTCANAHIKAHFCSCLDWIEEKDMNNKIVLMAAKKVIDYFNKQNLEVDGRCANLTLGKMISARLLKPNDQLMAFKESLDFDNYTPNFSADKELHSVLYQIRFVTEPGGGDWEASLTYFMKLGEFGMSYEDISRLNAYHEQAQCVINTHQHLRTFCYCL